MKMLAESASQSSVPETFKNPPTPPESVASEKPGPNLESRKRPPPSDNDPGSDDEISDEEFQHMDSRLVELICLILNVQNRNFKIFVISKLKNATIGSAIFAGSIRFNVTMATSNN